MTLRPLDSFFFGLLPINNQNLPFDLLGCQARSNALGSKQYSYFRVKFRLLAHKQINEHL
jgi:hypothetical protein